MQALPADDVRRRVDHHPDGRAGEARPSGRGRRPEVGFDALLDSGVLAIIFPEVHAMVGFGDGEWQSWRRVEARSRSCVRRCLASRCGGPRLFHDIGEREDALHRSAGQGALPRSRRRSVRACSTSSKSAQWHVLRASPEPNLRETILFPPVPAAAREPI